MMNKTIKVNIPKGHKSLYLISRENTFISIINSKNIFAEIKDKIYYSFYIDKLEILNRLYAYETNALNEDNIIAHLIETLMDLIQGYHFMTCCCDCIEEFADEFGFIYDDTMPEEKQEVEKAYKRALEQTKIIPQVFTEEELDTLYECLYGREEN